MLTDEQLDALSKQRAAICKKYAQQVAALTARNAELQQELDVMRLLAAEPHAIQKVRDTFGPLSLWTADGLKRHVDEQVAELRASNAELVDALKDCALWLHDAKPETAGYELLQTVTQAIKQAEA